MRRSRALALVRRRQLQIVKSPLTIPCCLQPLYMSRCYALPLVVALKHNHKGNSDASRCDKGARSSRYKVVEVQGRRGSRFVEVQGSSRMRAWCDLPRCRPTERVRSSRCIHETQSESAEELRRASSSLLIAPSASPSSSVHPTSSILIEVLQPGLLRYVT